MQHMFSFDSVLSSESTASDSDRSSYLQDLPSYKRATIKELKIGLTGESELKRTSLSFGLQLSCGDVNIESMTNIGVLRGFTMHKRAV